MSDIENKISPVKNKINYRLLYDIAAKNIGPISWSQYIGSK